MRPTPVDWPAIRTKFEQGYRQASLAREYGITQQAISKRALKEGWQAASVVPPTTDYNIPQSDNSDPQNILATIAILLQKVTERAKDDNLEIKDIKLIADALSQFHKIRLTSPDDKPTESGLPSELLPWLDNEQLTELARLRSAMDDILDSAKAKMLEQAQGIKSIHRKVG